MDIRGLRNGDSDKAKKLVIEETDDVGKCSIKNAKPIEIGGKQFCATMYRENENGKLEIDDNWEPETIPEEAELITKKDAEQRHPELEV